MSDAAQRAGRDRRRRCRSLGAKRGGGTGAAALRPRDAADRRAGNLRPGPGARRAMGPRCRQRGRRHQRTDAGGGHARHAGRRAGRHPGGKPPRVGGQGAGVRHRLVGSGEGGRADRQRREGGGAVGGRQFCADREARRLRLYHVPARRRGYHRGRAIRGAHDGPEARRRALHQQRDRRRRGGHLPQGLHAGRAARSWPTRRTIRKRPTGPDRS